MDKDLENLTIKEAANLGDEYKILFYMCKVLDINVDTPIDRIGMFFIINLRRLIHMLKNRV